MTATVTELPTVISLVTEWRTARERYDVSDPTNDETDRHLDNDARLTFAVARTPARSGAELKLKFELLLHVMSISNKWVDDRDYILAESLKADFDRMAGGVA